MKKQLLNVFLLAGLLLFAAGCDCEKINFRGMTKEQIAEILENAPKRKDGCFCVRYALPDSPPDTLVHHFHKNKESLLKSPAAMNSRQWQVFFHRDCHIWHSYLLEFKNGVVVKQEDRRQPHWTMAEP